MPGIFDTPLSRRKFLAASMAAAGSAYAGRGWADDASPQAARLALLSDTHIPANTPDGYRGFIPADNLNLVVPQVVAAGSHAAIINGDAARLTGEHEDYVVLKALLQPMADQMPIHIGLGNHDNRDNFFQNFDQFQIDEQPTNRTPLVADKHVSLFELFGTRFVVLDSLLYVNQVAGLLGQQQREWLARFLDEPDDRPIVFFVHHTLGDGDGDLLDFDRVFRIMQPHRKVKAIFYGHSHEYRIDQREHIYLINQPAVGYNFSDDEPVGWLDASFTPQGVDLTLHAVGGNVENDGEVKNVVWE
jgi:Icc protein